MIGLFCRLRGRRDPRVWGMRCLFPRIGILGPRCTIDMFLVRIRILRRCGVGGGLWGRFCSGAFCGFLSRGVLSPGRLVLEMVSMGDVVWDCEQRWVDLSSYLLTISRDL